jgi:hypothetical protein
MRRVVVSLTVSGVAGVVAMALSGCAAGTSGPTAAQQNGCGAYIDVSPSSATADHAAQAPGNQVQFITITGQKCTNGAYSNAIAVIYPGWTNPDPLDISISSAADATNGTAICKNTTAGPVTLTASATLSGAVYQQSVQLTCK